MRIDPRLERPLLTGDVKSYIGVEFAARFPKILSSRKLEKDMRIFAQMNAMHTPENGSREVPLPSKHG